MIIFKNWPALTILVCAIIAAIATFFIAIQSQNQNDRIETLSKENKSLSQNNATLGNRNVELGEQNQKLIMNNQDEIKNINEQLKQHALKYDEGTGNIIVLGKAGSINQSGGITVAGGNKGFINQGDGNTFNQQINPEVPQRHFAEKDFDWIKANLPKATGLMTTIYNSDPESMRYAKEIEDFLEKKGFLIMVKPSGVIHGSYSHDKIGKVDIEKSEDATWFKIIIYPLF